MRHRLMIIIMRTVEENLRNLVAMTIGQVRDLNPVRNERQHDLILLRVIIMVARNTENPVVNPVLVIQVDGEVVGMMSMTITNEAVRSRVTNAGLDQGGQFISYSFCSQYFS